MIAVNVYYVKYFSRFPKPPNQNRFIGAIAHTIYTGMRRRRLHIPVILNKRMHFPVQGGVQPSVAPFK